VAVCVIYALTIGFALWILVAAAIMQA